MKLFTSEIYKIISQKKLWFFIVVGLFINGLFLNQEQINPKNSFFEISPSAYVEINDTLQNFTSNDEKLTYLKENIEFLKAVQDVQYTPVELLDDEQKKIYDQISGNDDYLKYTDSVYSELSLYNKILVEVTDIVNYNNFLDKIQEEADNLTSVSIFAKEDCFSTRNILKTAEQYNAMYGTKLTHDISQGVNMISDFAISDVFILLNYYFHL